MSVEVLGTTSVALGEETAYRSALRQAFYKSVEQGVGVFVRKVVSVKNNRDVFSVMHAESQGYVREYEEISRGQTGNGQYSVAIRATVCKGTPSPQSDERVQQLVTQAVLGRPRVLIIATTNKGATIRSLLTSALEGRLSAAGYRVLAPASDNGRAAGEWSGPDFVDTRLLGLSDLRLELDRTQVVER